MDVSPGLQDDLSIPDTELLYRVIHPDFVTDGGGIRSPAFKSRTNPDISVDLGSLATPEETSQRPGLTVGGVARLVTGPVRQITPGVARDPIESNPAHALIIHDFGLTPGQWKEVSRKLARACVWAVPPTGHGIASPPPA